MSSCGRQAPKTSRSGSGAIPAMPASQVRHRVEPPPQSIAGLPDTLERTRRRAAGAATIRACTRAAHNPRARLNGAPVIASEAKQSGCGLPRRSAPRTDSAISIAIGASPRPPDALTSVHGQGCAAGPPRPGGRLEFLCEPVDVEPHALTDFDKEVDALRAMLGMKRVMTVDELRRGIEAIPEAEYHRLTLLSPLDPLDHRQPAGQGRDHRGGAARRAGRV